MYLRSLRAVPADAKKALAAAQARETDGVARTTLDLMVANARAAEERGHFLCSDSGVPTYIVRIGTKVTFDGDVKRAIRDGFAEVVATSDPPLLKHVTNPLTNERGYAGKDMPIVTFDVLDGADYVEIICSPKALGSGRWAALEIFTFPSLAEIEEYVLKVVLRAGSQACPPLVVGVGIGGTFDYATKLAKESVVRPMGQSHPDPVVADMERRLLAAVNETGFGPMGTGGATTAMAVHVDYAAGHGFTPVAVCFNCWIDRRTRVRISDDGTVSETE
ncbi:fumarate hydratase subunit alpha [Amycolatopsis mediterranei S699]|uniref:Fumarate hydratase subunit alpha n=2 Tax=Amycolatopsis mediterranei TaxID=33910 RepID=A0A0H3DH80_AMYMU|nr:fumarate hydratase subunit alpha [Amycolatopsis mediterranei U32]AFO80702.1 fumarate hydratase subunit alpha [Amycolatopsis mediterranei S699]AGT87830.1 fumarate hydratase subunit alpha [Amycolatopsis mediterranei RB]